ncbi:MAG: hypothetical protein UHK60_06475 [Acutalibacteraceae bacterium]|nr:hypothetical protein [Acutalibacteraceae bacterium]
MPKNSKYETLTKRTKNIALLWKNSHGFAPDSVTNKLDIAMLDWQSELTNALKIWIDKGINMTTGELILARTNMGAIVESWLKFFFCVYYEDYIKSPITKNNGEIIDPENATFDKLKNFSSDKLWKDTNSEEYKFVNSIQYKRNAIHSFKYRDIGTPQDFLDDIDKLCDFVELISDHLPPIEDYIDTFPSGYIFNEYYD